jgi:hypothetical protein
VTGTGWGNGFGFGDEEGPTDNRRTFYLLVEVLHAYANGNPQLDAAMDCLVEPSDAWIPDSGPSWKGSPGGGDVPPVPQRSLQRRLTDEQREAIIKAYASGVLQKDLTTQYGICNRSVKRLVANARKSGALLRSRAT